MATIPAVSLKGAPTPMHRLAEFEPHTVRTKTIEVDGEDTTVLDLDPVVARTDTPAAIEARAVLARRSRARL
ncbi:hypothetical protein WCD74_11615 [Actinomycetospora sp. OC33-EN08]|uniref:Uncharacterized protein n=1 Tax=Actinomycetospora aurantiaca TaxID=3129233 RepID=A0ABU8MM88_9PSEU